MRLIDQPHPKALLRKSARSAISQKDVQQRQQKNPRKAFVVVFVASMDTIAVPALRDHR
jgi:hypothetical protein